MARVILPFVGGWSMDDRELLEAALSAVEWGTKTATSAGVPGQLAMDATNLYGCTALNTWKKLVWQSI